MVVDGGRWNPWRTLRERVHLELWWGRLAGCGGLLEDLGGGRRRVWLDVRLDRTERRCVLAHELVHDERGILFDRSSPALLVAKEESAVNREVVRRLVPIDELASFVRARAEVEPMTALVVADEWDVTELVAERALARLRHPSMGVSRSRGAS